MSKTPTNKSLTAQEFVAKWSGREGGQERANYGLFLSELCDVIGVARPDPAGATHELNDYVFERRVVRRLPDGKRESGRIDLYKRDCFILEAKQSRLKGPKRVPPEQGDLFSDQRLDSRDARVGIFDSLMVNARRQAEKYARTLPADHSYPPFVLACDVGRSIEVYADFSGHGRHYNTFPDAKGFRIELHELTDGSVRERLRTIWEDPRSLDPAQQTAKVTREIAGQLAHISRALENRGVDARVVALFLMRCLFTMFVEDVGLIKKGGFTELLDRCVEDPKRFPHEMEDLWRRMDLGGYSPAIGEKLLRFNGKLFKHANALVLTADEIELLRKAARADWRDLEPAIFGTLFEQALDPEERRSLGAHYTPRPYVERLVNATIMEPLMDDWSIAQMAADRALQDGSKSAAVRELEDFLKDLSKTRVLDPACGTGNFLYVALRQMKQLEGEVLTQIQDLAGEEASRRLAEVSVTPDQFFGIETNPRAVEIAELVLWIGYLQWHLRTRSNPPSEPILGDKDHVVHMDALLKWDGSPLPQVIRGKEVYPNARRARWPSADFVIGNPPFIGGKDIRSRRGDGYAETLWRVYKNINPSADFVMYWWDRCAEILTSGRTRLRRFGLVTTNSISQVFQRRVVERRLKAGKPISILLAIPDHPWTKATRDAAAVRIAMTVAVAGSSHGTLQEVVTEEGLDTDEPSITFQEVEGQINPDLSIGADIASALDLKSNDGLCSPGVKLHGDGFIVSPRKACSLGLGARLELDRHIRKYRNGRDLTTRPRGVMVIDLLGLKADEIRSQFPEVYEYLLEAVKPSRDQNHRQTYRDNWWLFGEPRRELRSALAGLSRYIVTVETTKHRTFQFLDSDTLPDNMLVAVASDDAFHLGVLSSSIHVSWTLRSGATLEDRPRYSKSRCFDPFPFPEASAALKEEIRLLAEELDVTRKTVLETNPDITLTALYNVLEKYRSGDGLTIKEEKVKSEGRVLIIKDLHDQIDSAVFRAYGWPADLSKASVATRLLNLNAERAKEERRGFIRWLRPDYQVDKFGPLAHRADRIQQITRAKVRKITFPRDPKTQANIVLKLVRDRRSPVTPEELAVNFKEGKRVIEDLNEILHSLNRLGKADTYDNGRSFVCAA